MEGQEEEEEKKFGKTRQVLPTAADKVWHVGTGEEAWEEEEEEEEEEDKKEQTKRRVKKKTPLVGQATQPRVAYVAAL